MTITVQPSQPQNQTSTIAPTVQPAPVETAPVPAKTDTPPEKMVPFTQLARLEKAYREQARQVKELNTLKAQWEAEKNAPKTPDVSWKDNIKNDLIGTLAEAGLSYDDVINTFVNHTPVDQNVKILQSKLKQIEDGQQKILKQMNESEKTNRTSAIKQIRMEVNQLAKADPEAFEVINHYGPMGEQAVAKLMEMTYDEDGYLMDVNQAVQDVEDYLTDQALKVAKLKKIQARLAPKPQPPAPKVVQTKGPTTLTHEMSVATRPAKTEKERRQRAVQAWEANNALIKQG